MAARQWTPEQRARQSKLIHKWKPWNQSTGARTPEGKRIVSKNAVNYALREIMRESNRVNRELLNFIKGSGNAPDWDNATAKMNHLISNFEVALAKQ